MRMTIKLDYGKNGLAIVREDSTLIDYSGE